MDKQFYARYLYAVASVLSQTDAGHRKWGRRQALPGGVPFRVLTAPAAGPQCVTVTLQIRDEDLKKVLGLSDRLALAAGSQFARVYRDLAAVRIEFTLPPSQWRAVHLSKLRHRPRSATFGQKALGPIARMDWTTPHKAIFGSTQSGKTTCLADLLISLARTHQPEECGFLILNPKNDSSLHPFSRLAHLAAPAANDYDRSADLLRYALAEMERRRHNQARPRPRLVVVVDEIAQLTQVRPEVGPILTQLSQMAGGLKINLVVASQAANPGVFGDKGSLAKANFAGRIVFQLPREQAWLATGVAGQQTDRLGGQGDGLAIANGQVTRIRAALPSEQDYANLPRRAAAPVSPRSDQLAGDRAIEKPAADENDGREGIDQPWQIDPARLAYALLVRSSASAIREQFGGGTTSAMQVRDYAFLLRREITRWRAKKGKQP
jgi:hypothetical protein